ncbi:type II secretion system GspH family protein [Eubacteriales bacterium OttesenSCG-928-K08]|nr:type II secretion system GspH family protein [Eubacteriales bacterium OttesenSCG-928-K08]
MVKRLQKLIKSKKGMTLIELVIAMSLLVVLLAVTIIMMISTFGSYAGNAEYMQARQIGDAALDYISEVIPFASGVSVDSTLPAATAGATIYFLSVDGVNPSASGYLYCRTVEQTYPVFGLTEFYAGTKISFALNGDITAPTLTVNVTRDNEGEYVNSRTTKLLNASGYTGSIAPEAPFVLTLTTAVVPEPDITTN